MIGRDRLVRPLLLFSLALNLAVLGIVAIRRLAHVRREPPAMIDLRAELKLAPDQERSFDELRDRFHGAREEHQRAMGAIRTALLHELLAEHPDRTRIDGLLADIARHQGEVQRRLVDHLIDERALLHPEQRPAFEAIMKRRLASPIDEPPPGANPDPRGANQDQRRR